MPKKREKKWLTNNFINNKKQVTQEKNNHLQIIREFLEHNELFLLLFVDLK